MKFVKPIKLTCVSYQDFPLLVGKDVYFQGMVHRLRKMSDFSFVIIRTNRELVQCIGSAEPGFEEGASVRLFGTVVKDASRDDRFELHIKSHELLSVAAELPPFTTNKKTLNIPLDTKLAYRPIALRHPHERAAFIIESTLVNAFRTFMLSQGFTEIQAPKIVAAGAEGGADMFSVEYFEKKAYLTQSPQMYKQMMVGVFERVFTIGSVFRAEKHNTNRHLNEFVGLDFEMGFIDSFEDIMAMEVALLKFIFDKINEECANELAELNVVLPKIKDVPQITFTDAKKLIAEKFKRQSRTEDDLEPEEEKLLGKYFKDNFDSELVFITHYPAKKRPFYTMDDPERPGYTLGFDLLLNGAEITTGGQRIHDYKMQVDKMHSLGMKPEHFEDYLQMHKYGIPPHGGLGLGLERLAMKLLNAENVRDVTLFPRDRERINP
jgi:nondiscriminating aspartyl-tRNA synthetase